MAKSTDVLDNVMDQMTELNKKMTDFSSHLMSMVENYDVLMHATVSTLFGRTTR